MGDKMGDVAGDVAGDVGGDVGGDVAGDVGTTLAVYRAQNRGAVAADVDGDIGVNIDGDVGAIVTGNANVPTMATTDRARSYASLAFAAATQKGYRSDLRDFTEWCRSRNVCELPATPQAIKDYLEDRAATLAVATLTRRLAAIATAHRLAGHPVDTKHSAIGLTMRSIRRQHGCAQRQAAPATVDLVKSMAGTCDHSLLGLRDRALLLFGLAGGLRRSELVALRMENIVESPEGFRVTIERSKTDQWGEGQTIGVARTKTLTCPVEALKTWMVAASITEGAIFRSVTRHGQVGSTLSGRAVALIVKRRAEAAGLDPERFAAHSLRSGLATSAAAAGLEERDIQRQTRHKSVATLRKYIRSGGLFINNISAKIGL